MNDFEYLLLSEIQPNEIYLGSVYAAQNKRILETYNIKSVLSVGFETEFPIEIQTKKWIQINDHPKENIKQFFEETNEFISTCPKPLLIHCEMGQSRSATITIAYLLSQGMKLHEAYHHVSSVRPFIEPNMGFWYQLYQYSQQLYYDNEDTILFLYNKFGNISQTSDITKAKQFIKEFAQFGFHRKVWWKHILQLKSNEQ